MKRYKKVITDNISYTDLVYGRINKKLSLDLTNDKIERLILGILSETDEKNFIKSGKNIYITNISKNVRLTINSYTNRIITADKLKKLKTKEKAKYN